MWEKWTVDIIAERIPDQLLEARPTAKLAHRFFRKGRRDGRRSYPHESVNRLITDAVSVAGSKIAEAYLAERARLQEQLTAAEEQERAARTELQRQPTTSAPNQDTDRAPAEDQGGALAVALASRRRASMVRAQQLAAEERRRQEAAAAQAVQERGAVAARLENVRDPYLQKWVSVQATGQLLWTRYCNGYATGAARREAPDDETMPPTTAIEFTPPAVLVAREEQTDRSGHGMV